MQIEIFWLAKHKKYGTVLREIPNYGYNSKGKTTFTVLDEIQTKYPRLLEWSSQQNPWMMVSVSIGLIYCLRWIAIRYSVSSISSKQRKNLMNSKKVSNWNRYAQQKTHEWVANIRNEEEKEEIAAKEAADKQDKTEDAQSVLSNW